MLDFGSSKPRWLSCTRRIDSVLPSVVGQAELLPQAHQVGVRGPQARVQNHDLVRDPLEPDRRPHVSELGTGSVSYSAPRAVHRRSDRSDDLDSRTHVLDGPVSYTHLTLPTSDLV